MADIRFDMLDVDEVTVTLGLFVDGAQVGISHLEDYEENIPTFTGIEMADGIDVSMEEVMEVFCELMREKRYNVLKMFGNTKEECEYYGFEVAEAKSYGWDKAYTAYREL